MKKGFTAAVLNRKYLDVYFFLEIVPKLVLPKVQTAAIGQAVKFYCKSNENVKWYHNNTQILNSVPYVISPSQDGKASVLKICEIKKTDMGKYTCEAHNINEYRMYEGYGTLRVLRSNRIQCMYQNISSL